MADYRMLYASIKNPTVILGELPIEEAFYTKVLNAPGALGGTVPLDPYGPARLRAVKPLYPTTWYQPGNGNGNALFVARDNTATEARSEAKALFGPNNFDVASTVVYLERDGVILKGGIVWGGVGSVTTDTYGFQAEGWHSYFRQTMVLNTLTYTATDQDGIARALVDHAQAHGGGDIGVSTTANSHGVTRDLTYYWHEGKWIGEAIEQLAAVDDGFEFDYVSSYDGNGDIRTDFVTHYPTSGRMTEHVFELGTNVELVDYSRDGKSIVNYHRAFGAGFGTEIQINDQLESTSTLTRPLLHGKSSHPDVIRAATLAQHALRGIQRGSEPSVLMTMSVHPDAIPGLGSYEVGDRVRVSADRGHIQYDRDWFRIVAHEVGISQTEGETSSVVLAPLGLFV